MTPMTMPRERVRNIPTLDGWRAIAILLVLGHHFATTISGTSEKVYWATNPGRFGTIGVAIFFGLSGLLICKLLLEEFDRTGRISLASFYIRRCARILPPVWTYIAVVAALGLMRGPAELWGCLGFVRNYIPVSHAGDYTAHLWTLAVEEHFYLLWPALLCLLLAGSRPLLKTAMLAFALGLWRMADIHLGILAKVAPILDTPWRSDYRLDGLLWGCAAAFVLHRRESRELLVRWFTWPWMAFAVACFIGIQAISIPLGAVWMSIVIVAMMLATTTHPQWAFSRFLDWEPIRWIGRISYSVYLWQQFFLVPSWEKHPFPLAQRWPGNLIAMLACSVLSYYLIEKPFIRLGRRLLAKPSAPVNGGLQSAGSFVEPESAHASRD